MGNESYNKNPVENFEEQFSHTEKIEIAGGIAEVIDVKPEHQKTEVPVFFVSGWGITHNIYKEPLKKLVEEERRVVSIATPRSGGNPLEALERLDVSLPEGAAKSPEQVRKALGILEVIKEKGIEKVDGLTHSEGALSMLLAATIQPEKFRNIVLFTPAGIVGEDNIFRLMNGFRAQSIRPQSMKDVPITEQDKAIGTQVLKELGAFLLKNPLRAIREVIDIQKSDVLEILKNLHDKGIGIVIMSTIDDPVFPMDMIQKNLKGEMKEGDQIVDGFLSVQGGHGEFGHNIVAVEKMLTALENKNR